MRYLMQLQHQQHQGDVQLGHGQVKIQQGQVELMATLERLQQDDVELAYGQAKLMDGQAQLQAHVSHLLTQQQQQIKGFSAIDSCSGQCFGSMIYIWYRFVVPIEMLLPQLILLALAL